MTPSREPCVKADIVDDCHQQSALPTKQPESSRAHASAGSGGHLKPQMIGELPATKGSNQTLPRRRFQGLFNSLSRVLCNFRSRYLFAIGLVSVFSFGRSLPPALVCTLKHTDSKSNTVGSTPMEVRGYHPLWQCVPTHFPPWIKS